MTNIFVQRALEAALNKLAKWRIVFASWQLGTRTDEDAECRAIKHHLELSIILRAELNAVIFVLLEKQVVSEDDWAAAVLGAAERLDADYQALFPGFRTTQDGLSINGAIAKDTMAGWPK